MFSTGFLMSGVNQLVIDNFLCPVSGAVHLPDPFHLIIRFKLLGDTVLCRHLFYKLRKHSFCLFVNFGQVVVQFAR